MGNTLSLFELPPTPRRRRAKPGSRSVASVRTAVRSQLADGLVHSLAPTASDEVAAFLESADFTNAVHQMLTVAMDRQASAMSRSGVYLEKAFVAVLREILPQHTVRADFELRTALAGLRQEGLPSSLALTDYRLAQAPLLQGAKRSYPDVVVFSDADEAVCLSLKASGIVDSTAASAEVELLQRSAKSILAKSVTSAVLLFDPPGRVTELERAAKAANVAVFKGPDIFIPITGESSPLLWESTKAQFVAQTVQEWTTG